MEIIEVHGKEFTIDTMDWSHKSAAEIASNELIAFLGSLSASEAAELHGLLLDCDVDTDIRNGERPVPEIHERMQTAESAAYEAATEGWLDKESGGIGNYFVGAR